MLNLKILRLTAWLLLIATLISLISGFFSLKPFLASWLPAGLALQLHIGLAMLLFILLFYLHSLTGIFHLFSRHKNLKQKEFKIAAGIIWTIVLLILIYCFFVQYPLIAKNTITDTSNSANTNSNQSVLSENQTYTLAEIAKHNSAANCWMIIDNKVYNLTIYLNQHPGGARTILLYCGQDGSLAYATKDRSQPHSGNADNLLQQFYIGNLSK
jgi:cytochrome b involved in lipid metabolism